MCASLAPGIKYRAGPEHYAVQGRLSQAWNDKLHKIYVVMYRNWNFDIVLDLVLGDWCFAG